MAGFRQLRQVASLRSRVARKRQGIKTTDYNVKGTKATDAAKDAVVTKEKTAIKGKKLKV